MLSPGNYHVTVLHSAYEIIVHTFYGTWPQLQPGHTHVEHFLKLHFPICHFFLWYVLILLFEILNFQRCLLISLSYMKP